MFIILLFSVLQQVIARDCFYTECRTHPNCPRFYQYSGNHTYESCDLIPLYNHFECCLVEETSNACNVKIYWILLFLAFFCNFVFIKSF